MQADGQFERAFLEYQGKRMVRATRVQISANQLVGMIFHVPDGLEREVRNDIYRGRPAERYYDALEWIFSAPDYVRTFRTTAGPDRSRATERVPQSCIARTSSLDRISSARRAPGLAARHRAEERRPAGKHRLRAERARLQDVHAAAHAAVQQHRQLAADRGSNGRQCIQSRRGTVELAAAMVRHHHAVAADRRRALRRRRARSTPFSSSLPGHCSRRRLMYSQSRPASISRPTAVTMSVPAGVLKR